MLISYRAPYEAYDCTAYLLDSTGRYAKVQDVDSGAILWIPYGWMLP
jgi:hypothetical protein